MSVLYMGSIWRHGVDELTSVLIIAGLKVGYTPAVPCFKLSKSNWNDGVADDNAGELVILAVFIEIADKLGLIKGRPGKSNDDVEDCVESRDDRCLNADAPGVIGVIGLRSAVPSTNDFAKSSEVRISKSNTLFFKGVSATGVVFSDSDFIFFSFVLHFQSG